MSTSITQSAAAAGTPSQLLSLPPELRNHIYDYVIEEDDTARFCERGLVPPALARVCRQTRKEVVPMYKHTVGTSVDHLDVRIQDFDFRPFMAYLRSLAPVADMFKDFEDEEERSLEMVTFNISITETITPMKVRRIEDWLDFCETDEDFRWLQRSVTKSYNVNCVPFEGDRKAIRDVVAALRRLWEFSAEASDQRHILRAMEIAETTRAMSTQRKSFLRKRKLDEADEARVFKRR